MPPTQEQRPLTVAIIGNPNTGKSTLFNSLCGLQSRVGNYPGVTVEKKIGRVQWQSRQIDLIDLPGTYSLSPRTLDEMVSVDVLLGRQEDVGHPDIAPDEGVDPGDQEGDELQENDDRQLGQAAVQLATRGA